jgi:hypothetical protein
MSGLKGQTVATTYEGLIKTGDNTPITTTPKALSDGEGNLLPMEVSTLGIDWSGNQDFTGATVTGITGTTGAQGAQGATGAQGAIGAQGATGAQGAATPTNYYGGGKISVYAGGRPTTSFYKTSQMLRGAPVFSSPMPDHLANRLFTSPLYALSGQVVTSIAVPIAYTIASDNIHFGIYESSYANGGPETLVRSNVIPVGFEPTGGYWLTFNLSTPLTLEYGKTYWIALMTNLSSADTSFGKLYRDDIVGSQWFSVQNITDDPTSAQMLPYNVFTLETDGTLPATIAESTDTSTTFNGRDEALVVLWK